MIGTPTLKMHQEVIEAKDHMTQSLVLIGGVHQDLQVFKVQATMTLLQELRVMGHNMTQLQDLRIMGHNITQPQDLRNKAQVIMTLFQGFLHKDPTIMILRQELRKMQVNMAPLIEPQDKKM